jgi:hypothetical protein
MERLSTFESEMQDRSWNWAFDVPTKLFSENVSIFKVKDTTSVDALQADWQGPTEGMTQKESVDPFHLLFGSSTYQTLTKSSCHSISLPGPELLLAINVHLKNK